MAEKPDQSLLDGRVKQKGIRKAALEKVARAAGLWDGQEKVSIAILIERLCLPANLEKVWPHRDLLPEPPPDPMRLQVVRDALDTSTKVNRALGLSFVGFMFYILTIVASTTDLMIFLPESTVRLPIVDVELPLIGFYLVVPYVILAFHFNLLINLKQHQDKYRAWKQAAKPKAGEPNLLDPILINFLDTYPGLNVFRLLLLALIAGSLFYFPLANMIYMMGRFADYHDFGYSCLQAVAVAMDAALCFLFFDHVFLLEGRGWWQRLRVGHWPSAAMLGLAVWQFSLALCLHGRIENPAYMAWLYDTRDLPRIDLTNQAHLVGEVPDGYVVNYLKDSADVGYAKHQAYLGFGKQLILEGRDFRYANLDGVDLVGANMKGCRMDSVSMERADVSLAQMRLVSLRGARLSDLRGEGLDLVGAHLERADLSNSRLEGAKIFSANLEGAMISSAHLEGAWFANSYLNGTDLAYAHLEGADLSNAHLKGADLSNTHLEGAVLSNSYLEGADLSNAHLEGAGLVKCSFGGSNFSHAKLRHTNFDSIGYASLQDSALMADVDWGAPPALQEIFKDSSNGSFKKYGGVIGAISS